VTTKRAIRELVIDDLGLGFIGLMGTNVSDVSFTSVPIRDLIGDTDNRILEGSFIFFRQENNAAYNSAADLNANITISQTTFLVDQTIPGVEVGDIFRIGTEAMLVTGIDDMVSTQVGVTVERAVLGTTAATHSANDAINVYVTGQSRAVTSHSFSTDTITITRDSYVTGTTNFLYDIYFILNAHEINKSLDLALSKLWFKDEFSVTLTTTENQYDLTASASWLTDPGQIIGLDYRVIDDAGLITRDTPCVNRKIISDQDTIEVILYDRPSDNDNTTLRVTARRWYELVGNEDATITCPLPLARAASKVEVLTKVFNKLGKSAKENFGMELVLADKELEKMKARYKQSIQPVHLIQDEEIEPIVVPVDWRTEGNWW